MSATIPPTPCCSKGCLTAQPERRQQLHDTLGVLKAEQRTTTILTMLAMGIGMTPAVANQRTQFPYYLAYLGVVCQSAFRIALGISKDKLKSLRRQAQSSLAPATHGNKSNINAAKINTGLIVDWFKDLAQEIGEIVPIATRRKVKAGAPTDEPYANVAVTYTKKDYTLLPAYLTWMKLRAEYQLWAGPMYTEISDVHFMKE